MKVVDNIVSSEQAALNVQQAELAATVLQNPLLLQTYLATAGGSSQYLNHFTLLNYLHAFAGGSTGVTNTGGANNNNNNPKLENPDKCAVSNQQYNTTLLLQQQQQASLDIGKDNTKEMSLKW